jgi:hypothetical protein
VRRTANFNFEALLLFAHQRAKAISTLQIHSWFAVPQQMAMAGV